MFDVRSVVPRASCDNWPGPQWGRAVGGDSAVLSSGSGLVRGSARCPRYPPSWDPHRARGRHQVPATLHPDVGVHEPLSRDSKLLWGRVA